MIGNAAEPFDTEGNLMDATTKKLIRQLLQSLVQWTGGSRNLTSDRNRCTNGCKQNVWSAIPDGRISFSTMTGYAAQRLYRSFKVSDKNNASKR